MSVTLADLENAIKNGEGYGASRTNAPTRANNPGSLVLGDIGYGTTGFGGITVFPTLADGEAALKHQASLMLSGKSSVYSPDMTLAQANSTYTNGESSTSWAKSLGVDGNTTLADLAGSSLGSAVKSGVLSSIVPGLGSITSSLGISDWIFVALGLLLIAAGIFSFDKTRNVIIAGSKMATRAAEIAT